MASEEIWNSKLIIELDDPDLLSFNSYIEAGRISQNSADYELAEFLYKAAQQFSMDTWGPYQWPEAKALLELSDLYHLQNRKGEGDIAWLLASKILH